MVNNLTVSYNTGGKFDLIAVNNVSFVLEKNESLGIVGESGSGKTTLVSAILRTLDKNGKIINGSIILDDIDLSALPEKIFEEKIRWKKISMIFQGAMNSLDPVYTIRKQIIDLATSHNYELTDDIISEKLNQVGLDKSILSKYPHELSGGMKQRVIIVMALLLDPEIIIGDEPTTALDVLVQAQIINLLKKLKTELKKNIILISHDLAVISEISDKLAIMYDGEIVEFNSLEEIAKNPKHPYTVFLINSLNEFDKDKLNHHNQDNIRNHLIVNKNGCRYYNNCPHASDVCLKSPPVIQNKKGYVRCWLYNDDNTL